MVFFGASRMFAYLGKATEDEGSGTRLAAQLVAGGLLVVVIVLLVKRRK